MPANLFFILGLLCVVSALSTASEESLLYHLSAFDRSFSQDLDGTWWEYDNPNDAAYGDPPSLFDAFNFEQRNGKITTESAIEPVSGKFIIYITVYDGKYINNFFRFNLQGSIGTNLSTSRNYTEIKYEGGANFTHFYLLDLETLKFADNVTATLTWNNKKLVADLDIIIHDFRTAFKGQLTFFEINTHWDIGVYAVLLTASLILCAVYSFKELRNVSENLSYAKDISTLSLLMNATWNYFIFLAHLMLLMQSRFKVPLILPTILLFFYTNLMQMQIFIHIWRARNAGLLDNAATLDEVRVALFKHNCKIYLAIAAGIILIFQIILMPPLFCLFMSLLWIPQIASNIVNSTKYAPSLGLIISVTIEHTLIPVYLNFKDDNFLMYRPNPLLAMGLAATSIIQVVALYMQKRKGALYIVPKCLRPAAYNYMRQITEVEDLESGIIPYKECPICLVSVNKYPEEVTSSVPPTQYCQTPCNHDFHEKCLSEWLSYRNLCPVCRSPLPPLDDYE